MPSIYASNEAYPKQLTVLAVQVRSRKSLLHNCNFARFIAQNQTLSIILLLASLGNPSEDNNYNFERGSLIDIFFINIFNQLKGATKILLGVPPCGLFFFDRDSRIRFSKEYAA